MYALIENQKVIGVLAEVPALKDHAFNSVVPIDKQCLFSIYGNTVVGELIKDEYEDWIIQDEHCQHSLEDCDAWQPIGTWLTF